MTGHAGLEDVDVQTPDWLQDVAAMHLRPSNFGEVKIRW